MFAGLVLLPCCSSSSSTHPCVSAADGTLLSVGGISFVQRSMAVLEYAQPSGPGIFAEITISAATDACSESTSGAQSASTSEWRMLTFQINHATAGSFCVAAFGSPATTSCAWVRVLVRAAGTPANKGPSQFVDADSGTITLTAVDRLHVAGSYDVHFTTGEQVAGSFDAPACNMGSCAP